MAAKTSRAAKEPTAKRPSKKQVNEAAELAARKALEAEYLSPYLEITPLELAHLVAAMGLGDQKDGPQKALSLVFRSDAHIKAMKASLENLNSSCAKGKAIEARIMAEMGLSEEAKDKIFSLEQVIAKMPTEPLDVAGRKLRGKKLWNEFRRQVDPKPGRPGKLREDGTSPEEYLMCDLIRVYQEFREWRDKLAAENMTKARKNIDDANQKRREDASAGDGEAVDAVPLPKSAP